MEGGSQMYLEELKPGESRKGHGLEYCGNGEEIFCVLLLRECTRIFCFAINAGNFSFHPGLWWSEINQRIRATDILDPDSKKGTG